MQTLHLREQAPNLISHVTDIACPSLLEQIVWDIWIRGLPACPGSEFGALEQGSDNDLGYLALDRLEMPVPWNKDQTTTLVT